MSEKSFLKQHWKLILNIVTLVALVVVVIVTWRQIGETIRGVQHIQGWALLLVIPIEALNYHSQTKLYQRLFSIVGNRLSYKYLYRTALELNFVNHVFPSGGVTGMSYFTLRLRSRELSGAKATLIHLIKIGLYFVAFEIVLVFGVIALAVMGRANDVVILVASSISTLVVVGTLAFVYLVRSRERINNFFTSLTKILNRLIHLIRPRYPETINIRRARKVFDDFHDNYEAIKNSYPRLKKPFMYALLADVTEVMALYVVYIAFGHWVNIGAVILAYAIANVAGLISVLPGGVGIYEALMIAVLASMGVPPSVSLPVTVTHRVINTLIQIPPGYYLYQQALRRGERPPRVPDAGTTL